MSVTVEVSTPTDLSFHFHHLHVFVERDSLRPLADYKKLESQLNALASRGSFDPFSGGMRFLPAGALPARVEEGRQIWNQLVDPADRRDEAEYASAGQDFVEQLLVGLGWRVTAEYVGPTTRSVLVTSADPCGVKFCVTCALVGGDDADEPYDHFRRSHVERFLTAHGGRPGIAALGFEVAEEGGVEAILAQYRKRHPALLVWHAGAHAGAPSSDVTTGKRARVDWTLTYTDVRKVQAPAASSAAAAKPAAELELGRMRIGEVFAFYTADGAAADDGTVLRFVERAGTFASSPGFANPEGVLPGLADAAPVFDGTSIPAYSDHWVSNVLDREGFLRTLEEALGFTPKVDFNAGVVAAGEARIESTVTGNTSRRLAVSGADALVNQSQVYLPINNALSPVGHVHGFLQEIGQGIQHVASRVDDLKAFIERVNNYRLITGRGFTFLNIPRSYYGRLDAPLLAKHTTCSAVLREAVCAALVTAGLLSTTGILDLEAATERLRAALAGAALPVGLAEERDAKLEEIVATVRLSRYSNLHSLLRDHLQEEEYLQIVRNKILVDIQGSDILYQIFTANILQRRPGDEAPFLEFIQRVCADTRCKAPHEACSKPIRPGCGGFGIRNFLTLFLSIEVSKAMRELADAEEAADAAGCELARRKIELFTEQLDASNPILTDISDAMTSEGECLDQLAISTGSASDKALLRARADEMRAKKEAGNARLQEVSTQYATLMKSLRA